MQEKLRDMGCGIFTSVTKVKSSDFAIFFDSSVLIFFISKIIQILTDKIDIFMRDAKFIYTVHQLNTDFS